MKTTTRNISIMITVGLFVLSACGIATARLVIATVTPNSANIANPAAAYCRQQGNRPEIRTAADGSQNGVCIVPGGNECDEWAYYRGECSSESQSQAVAALSAKLAEELHVPGASLDVVSVQAASWSDACLGLPQDGENCALGFTPGFRVTLVSAGKKYTLHTNLSASVIRQEPS